MGQASLVLVSRMRSDGHRQNYWVAEGEVREGDERTAKEPKAPKGAGNKKAKEAAAKDAAAVLEKLKDGSSTSPEAANPTPANGMETPAAIDFAVPSAAAAVKQAQAQKWGWKGTLHPVAEKALVDMATAMHAGLAQNPGQEKLLGLGTKSVVAGNPGPGALGVYHPNKGEGKIILHPQVAQAIQDCLVSGEVSSYKQFQAFEVFAHESGHAASRMHQFEGINAKESSTQGRPHASMEEATTEIVGQHYAESVIKGFGLKMAIKDAGPFGLKPATGAPMFEYDAKTDMPKANTPVSYHSMVRNVAAMAMVAEEAKTPEEVGNATVNWGNALKRTRGGLRYERLADRMLEGHLPRDKDDDLYRGAVEYAVNAGGALPVKDPPPFTAARQELAEHLKMLVGTNKSIRVSILRAHVATVAAKHKKGGA